MLDEQIDRKFFVVKRARVGRMTADRGTRVFRRDEEAFLCFRLLTLNVFFGPHRQCAEMNNWRYEAVATACKTRRSGAGCLFLKHPVLNSFAPGSRACGEPKQFDQQMGHYARNSAERQANEPLRTRHTVCFGSSRIAPTHSRRWRI